MGDGAEITTKHLSVAGAKGWDEMALSCEGSLHACPWRFKAAI